MAKLKQTILVTGSAGFIGSNFVEELITQGYSVIGLDDMSGGFKENIHPYTIQYKGSITNTKLVEKIFKKHKPKIVFHLAAYAAECLSPHIRRFNYENNLIGSINLINASVNHNIKRFIFLSSIAVYGTNKTPMTEDLVPNPEDPYGISKLAVELDLKDAYNRFEMEYTIIRAFNVYGPGQNIYDKYRNVIGIFMNQIMQGKRPTIFGDGKQTRSFSYIKDVIPCIIKAGLSKKAKNQIINIGASEVYTVNQIANEVCKAMGTDLKPIHLPPRHEVKHANCSVKKAKRILGFKATYSLKQGILEMAEWAQRMGPGKPKKWKNIEIRKNLPKVWK